MRSKFFGKHFTAILPLAAAPICSLTCINSLRGWFAKPYGPSLITP